MSKSEYLTIICAIVTSQVLRALVCFYGVVWGAFALFHLCCFKKPWSYDQGFFRGEK